MKWSASSAAASASTSQCKALLIAQYLTIAPERYESIPNSDHLNTLTLTEQDGLTTLHIHIQYPSVEQRDADKNWRIIYRIDDDAILILEVFNKTTRTTPTSVIENCKKRLSKYDIDKQD